MGEKKTNTPSNTPAQNIGGTKRIEDLEEDKGKGFLFHRSTADINDLKHPIFHPGP